MVESASEGGEDGERGSGRSSTPPDAGLLGRVLDGRYRILEMLASGGMGTVYVAEQVPLGRRIALKVLETDRRGAEELHYGERFLLEAAAVAKLKHPNTVVVHDYGTSDDGLFYFTMELVDGINLHEAVRKQGPVTGPDVAHIGEQICGSLEEAHRAGLVHRDLKPSNVMLTRRGGDDLFVKVLDFGLVKWVGEAQDPGNSDLTRSGLVMGSPRYMSPEQVLGNPLDGRSDIYALGAVLYYALTGRPPFTASSQFEVLRAHVETMVPPLSFANPDLRHVSPRLEAAVLRCLEKSPDLRFATMAELAAELHGCLTDDATASGIDRTPYPLYASPSVRPSTPSGPAPSGMTPVADRADAEARPSAAPPAPTPAPMPAPDVGARDTPPARTRARWTVLAVALAALAALAALFVASRRPAAPPTEALATDLRAASATPADPPPTSSPAAVRAPPPALHPAPLAPTRVVSRPEGATVSRGEEDLGDAPLNLRIPADERWHLTLRLEGHESRTVSVTGGQGDVEVRLSAVEPPRRRRRAAPRRSPGLLEPAPAPSAPAATERTDIRNPWQ
ncbi:MAG: serine/threonine-protein kinase [Sandaracinaceae bacterium]